MRNRDAEYVYCIVGIYMYLNMHIYSTYILRTPRNSTKAKASAEKLPPVSVECGFGCPVAVEYSARGDSR